MSGGSRAPRQKIGTRLGARLSARVRAVHHRLLPASHDVGWTPYLWLFYLGFFIVRLVLEPPSPPILALAILSLLFFLVLYFDGFRCQGRRLVWNIAGITALAIVWTPSNPGAMTFFIYAAAFCGALGPPRVGWWALAAIVLTIFATGWAFERSWLWTGITVLLAVMIGASNVYFIEAARKNAELRRSKEQIEQLAAVAERERIARDLHDLLGHTLSLITIKAELARKLSERGDPRAATEIAEVEQISRDALQQVREAVTGFRRSGLDGELARATIACEARNIDLEIHVDPAALDLEPRHEATLAMVLREAVTNVVRHSLAEHCRIDLERAPHEVILRVADDGAGSADSSVATKKHHGRGRHDQGLGGQGLRGHGLRGHGLRGQGLLGMEQRLTALDGRLEINRGQRDRSHGWSVTAHLPVEPLGEVSEANDRRPLLESQGLAT